jgi:hypothetical protein
MAGRPVESKTISREELDFYQKWVSYLQSMARYAPCIAMHKKYANIKMVEIGAKVVEALRRHRRRDFAQEARQAWGQDTVIWINFPNILVRQATQYTKSFTQRPPGALVISLRRWGCEGDRSKRPTVFSRHTGHHGQSNSSAFTNQDLIICWLPGIYNVLSQEQAELIQRHCASEPGHGNPK